jgi:hypothetical protein
LNQTLGQLDLASAGGKSDSSPSRSQIKAPHFPGGDFLLLHSTRFCLFGFRLCALDTIFTILGFFNLLG